MTREQLVFACVLICTSLAVIGPHFIKRETLHDPALSEMAPGCVADLTVGWLDCFHVNDDGSWIRTRSY